MTDIQSQIRERIDEFVAELDQLVRRAAVQTVEDALSQGGKAPARRAPQAATSRAAGRRRKGEKRAPGEIDQTVEAVQSYVQKNPGQGVEQMGRELGKTTKDLALPIKKLIAAGTIRTEGHKRATPHFAGAARGRPRGGRRGRKARG
jgi:ElaB/YqjD/DUF883 family membrane-anchored ribosome-binding protein